MVKVQERTPVEGEWVSRGERIAFIAEIGSISKTEDAQFQAELFDGEVIAVDADQDMAMLSLENAIRRGRDGAK